jgi:aspartyl-tRNA(Asn)/glutamyl-tRNA(Gln) amidotransferase subunit A
MVAIESSPTYLSIAAAAERISAGTLSPVDLTRAVLERIEATDHLLNSYVLVLKDAALAEAEASAERARAGVRLGPLDGVPMAIKDIIDTGGSVTTNGTGAYRYRVPDHDATAVARLRAVGAVIIGKTNTHELAFGATTNNVHYGATHNPWHLERVPGGSSGGSGSAIAAGQALGALGTDTGGSVRGPASYCGITGIKPTWGLVSRAGVSPLSHTLDHVGPMTRSALDAALMLNALQGYDPLDLDSQPHTPEDYTAGIDDGIAGLTLAVIPSLLRYCAPDVRSAFEASLETLAGLGVRITEAEPTRGIDNPRALINGIVQVESYDYHEGIFHDDPPTIGAVVRSRMAPGATVPGYRYSRALDARKRLEQQFERVLFEQGIDAYVMPTTPTTAFPIDPDQDRDEGPPMWLSHTFLFNSSRQPAVSIPNGFDEDGLPTSLMIACAKWQDARALRIAHAFQQATDFHTRQPALPV